METIAFIGTLILIEAVSITITGIRILSEWGFTVIS
tara:strand:- start:49 stop:156 length:108 start_codon:yes stop_codon:yes gene_type:complete